jgi:hypothetical protein
MCCGGKRTVMQPSGTYRTDTDINVAGVSLAQFGAGSSFFEHVGAGNLIVHGPRSGKQYRFAGQGAVVAVDPQDRTSLMRVPHIRELPRR